MRKIPVSRFVNWALLFVMAWTICNLKYWNKDDRVVRSDVMHYYAYLPATFLEQDIHLSFVRENKEYYKDKLVPNVTEEGIRAIKMSSGMSLLYLPFFGAGHLLAMATGEPLTGYSWPYKMLLAFSALVYLAIGLNLLRRMLEERFSQWVTSLTLIAVVLCTQVFYYTTVEGPMSHVHSLTLVLAFLWYLRKWLKQKTWKTTLILGLLVGLIVLIRPVNVLVVLFFVFYGIASLKDIPPRIQELLASWKYIVPMVLAALLVWVPQLAYNYIVTGQWLFWSYLNEQFFFNSPHIIEGLFGIHKGWLVYTPVMVFALIGVVLCKKRYPAFFWPLVVLLPVLFYITFSWWCWWYGGSFGQRPLIDYYGLLAFPLAVTLQTVFAQKKWVRTGFVGVFAFFMALNLFQTRQYYGGVAMHWDGMSWEAYKATFFQLNPPDNFRELLTRPNYFRARTTGELEYISIDEQPEF